VCRQSSHSTQLRVRCLQSTTLTNEIASLPQEEEEEEKTKERPRPGIN
jgi:hypothetical protein